MSYKQCTKGHYYTGSGNCPYCGSDDYFLASIIFGVIWLIIDIFRIRRHRNNGNY